MAVKREATTVLAAPIEHAAAMAASSRARDANKRERDPICDVCGHNHVQGVKCKICGHVGKYIGASRHRIARHNAAPFYSLSRRRITTPPHILILRCSCSCAVPGGPNRPNRGAIPPVPPGPLNMPNNTLPTIEGLKVQEFQQALQTFFHMLVNAEQQGNGVPQLPAELANLDQLKVLLDALPDYHADDEQPSYVLAIPCRPILVGLSSLGVIQSGTINWGSVMTYAASDGMHLNRIVDWSSMPPPRPPVPSPSYHGQELQNAGYGGSSG